MEKMVRYLLPLNDDFELEPELLLNRAPTYATRNLIVGSVLFIVALVLKNHDYVAAYRVLYGLGCFFAANFGFFVGAVLGNIPKKQ